VIFGEQLTVSNGRLHSFRYILLNPNVVVSSYQVEHIGYEQFLLDTKYVYK